MNFLVDNPDIRRLAEALSPAELRPVGGAVRDVLLGLKPQDIDLATTLLPEKVMEMLAAKGIAVKPTGIAFGTVTAILAGKPYEITTLRRDTECDGRHVKVEYSENWREDAARRDFTINAMSIDTAGNIHDYFEGRQDLAAGRLRFVGDAAARIREDYLRILRLFRFQAYFGRQPLDAAILAACTRNKTGIAGLSGERIQKEMLKLLAAPNPAPALAAMQDCGVLVLVLPSVTEGELKALPGLIAQEQKHADEIPDDSLSRPLRRLAFLLHQPVLTAIAKRWKLSRADEKYLAQLLTLRAQKWSEAGYKHIIRKYGNRLALDYALLAEPEKLGESLAILKNFIPPVFPVTGEDVMRLYPELKGKAIGDWLAEAEERWEKSGYTLSREALLKP